VVPKVSTLDFISYSRKLNPDKRISLDFNLIDSFKNVEFIDTKAEDYLLEAIFRRIDHDCDHAINYAEFMEVINGVMCTTDESRRSADRSTYEEHNVFLTGDRDKQE